MHYSVAKLKQIEAIEFAVIDTADPKTPQTALARFIKNVSNIKSASARADLYKQVIDAPGLDDTEKAWVKIIQIFDTQGNGPEERTKLMEDISNVAISTSPETVTAADVLEHAADSPEGWKFFRALGKIFTHDNAQKVAPLAAIVFPQAAPVLVAYGLRNVPVNVYGAFTVDCEQKRADHVRAVIGGLGDGLKNSGPLVKPLAWIGMKLGWIGSAIELFMKDGVKSLASNLSDKKKSEEMMAFLESINNDPKSAVQIFDNLGTYFGSKSDVIAGFAITAVHAKFGNAGTLILKHLSDRGFFDALLKGDEKKAEAIKASVDPKGVVTAELEKIRNEETAELSAIVPCAIEKPNSLMARLSLVTAFGPSTASITPPVFSGYVGLNASNDALRNER